LLPLNTKQRKLDLINWVNELTNESLLNRLEELKHESQVDIPKEIISLLDTSNAVENSDLIEHSNTRELLNNL
jgi:hypothetical protein